MRMLRKMIGRVPVLGGLLRRAYRAVVSRVRPRRPFVDSSQYWNERYQQGATSGTGSYGRLAAFKAEVINSLVREYGLKTVIESGCGDGNQLELAEYPSYLGLDVSPVAVARCSERFKGDDTKAFKLVGDYAGETAELALSLDVIFHLVEDDVFDGYMRALFGAATRYVVIYSSNFEAKPGTLPPHVRHRVFTEWVRQNADEWCLVKHLPNRFPGDGKTGETSPSDFYVYRKGGEGV